MNRHSRLAALAFAAFTLGACAFIPQANLRLDEARRASSEARADSQATRHASAEMSRADEALERATAAWSTLDDPAVVDHLAYVAKQRFAIAREAARRAAAEEQLRGAAATTAVSIR